MKTRRAKGGRNRHPTAAEDNPPDLSPLDFALALMRDETQPPALRASMAKAAMPYLHQRADGDVPPGDEPSKAPRTPPMSDLELARRIAHILTRAQSQAGNPVEKPANAGQDATHAGPVGAKTS